MDQITQAMLKRLVNTINRKLGTPVTPYRVKEDGIGCVSNEGNYHLDWANGGVSLCRMAGGGGTHDVLRCGHITKRDLFGRMQAFLEGIRVERGE